MTTRRSLVLRTPIVLAAAGAQARAGAAPASRGLLAGRFTPESLARVLLPRGRWLPFAPAATRAAWETLPAPLRKDLVAAGERHLGKEWPLLPASVFLDYARDGNRSRYEAIRNARRERLRELAAAECVEAKGRFTDEIVNGVWATCEETFWGVPAHLSLQKAGPGLPDVTEPVVDLFAAETASLLAWTDYLLGPQLARVNKLVRPRIEYEMQRRILVPNLERDDFWWMGFDPKRTTLNNWTPWIDSNWLTAALLLEPNEKRRVAAVHKILRSLDRFLDGYADDGGCDEGPGYWGRAGGSLFDCLELLHSATGGAADFYREPLIQEIGRYIYRAHIAGDWFTNFADASARNRINPELVFRYGKAIGDEKMQALAGFAAAGRGDRVSVDSLGRQLSALFLSGGLASAPARPPLVRDAWMPGIQVMTARVKEGSTDGLYLAAQGGHNAESHNHNDVGNFIVFAGGQPVIIDVGVETYTAKTFSSSRYDIWTMQSAYHNLPTLGRVMQRAGREFEATEVAYRSNDREVEFKLSLAHAYPKEAGIRFWNRSLRLDRAANEILLTDAYALSAAAPDITWTVMTVAKPAVASGEVRLGLVRLLYDSALTPAVEEIPLKDGRLRGSWGETVYRVLFKNAGPPLEATRRFRILGPA